MRETIKCLRPLLTGARSEYAGRHVSSRGFRLRSAQPDTRIALGAFGPGMIRVAAQHADELVLNEAAKLVQQELHWPDCSSILLWSESTPRPQRPAATRRG